MWIWLGPENRDDDRKISEVDWVIEVVVERLDIKETIYQKLLPHLKKKPYLPQTLRESLYMTSLKICR